MSIGKKVFHSFLWSNTGHYTGFIFSFIAHLILVRLLAPEAFGTIGLSLAVLGFLSFLTGWSFSQSIIQIQDKKQDLFDTVFWLIIIQIIIFMIVCSLITIPIQHFYPNNKELPAIFFALSINQSIGFLASGYSAILRKEFKFKHLSIIRIFSMLIASTTAVILAINGFGIWSLVSKELISNLILLVLFKHASEWKFQYKFNLATAKKVLDYAYRMLFARSFESIFFKLDNFIIGILGGIQTLGYYIQAKYLADLVVSSVSPATTQVAFPLYSKIQDDEASLKRILSLSNYFLIRLMLLVTLLLLLFPTEIITGLFGSKWLPSAALLQCFAFYPLLLSIFKNLQVFLYSIGRVGRLVTIIAIQIASAITLMLLGYKLYSINGATIGFNIAILIGCIFIYLTCTKYIENTVKSLFFPILAALISGSCVIYISHLGHSPLLSAALVILTIFLYIAILFILEHKTLTQNLKIIYNKVQE